jgi:hypothetical protein
MENLLNYLNDFANGWTAIDLIIMFSLSVIAFRLNKKVQAKEKLLKFSDISISQMKEEILDNRKDIVELENSIDIIREKLNKKEKYIDHLIKRPTVNGKFVKKDYKPVVGYKAKEDGYNAKGLRVFTELMQYPQIKAKTLTLIGDDGNKYVIDRRKFEHVY